MNFFKQTIDPDRTYHYAIEYKTPEGCWAIRPIMARDVLAAKRTFEAYGIGFFRSIRHIDRTEYESLVRNTMSKAQGAA